MTEFRSASRGRGCAGEKPRFDNLRYYHRAKGKWSDEGDFSPGFELFNNRDNWHYTHVSAAWIADAQCWIMIYAKGWAATLTHREPIKARIG